MNTRRLLTMLLAAALAAGCAAQPTAAPEPTVASAPQAEVPTAVPPVPTVTTIPLPTLAALPPPAAIPAVCAPQVTANTVVNVRNGPGTIYSVVGALNQGETATVDGKNAEGTWWRILHAGTKDGHGWVAGSVTTSSCISPSVTVVDPSLYPAPFLAAVTNVVVGVDPEEINVPGCTGEARKMTAGATIYASGPMEITYYFEIDGWATKARTLTFSEYGSKSVSETFRPTADEGNHWVGLQIEGLDVRGWQSSAKFRITC